MNKKIISVLSIVTLCMAIIFSGCTEDDKIPTEESDTLIVGISTSEIAYPAVVHQEVSEEVIDDDEFDIRLIALVTMAEAESESDTVHDVVYQPYQFSSMWDGRADRCEVQEDICDLVREEMNKRSNYDCIFFNSENYSEYGAPMFQVEHHYFSSYE